MHAWILNVNYIILIDKGIIIERKENIPVTAVVH